MAGNGSKIVILASLSETVVANIDVEPDVSVENHPFHAEVAFELGNIDFSENHC